MDMNQKLELDFNLYIGLKEALDLPKMTRVAVRAVVIKNDNVLLLSSNRGDLKFPGGGIEADESYEAALEREMREETGFKSIEVVKKLGVVSERKIDDYDENHVFEMISHYYTCHVTGEKEQQNLDDYEAELEFKPTWVSIDEAIRLNNIYITNNPDQPGWAKRENMVLELLSGRQ